MQKKILFLIPSLEVGGGAEKIVSSLTIKFSERYEVFIITYYNIKDNYPFKGRFFSFRLKLKSWKRLLLPIKIYKLTKLITPNLIISFMDHTNALAIVTKILFGIKTPLVVSVRCNPRLQYKEELRYLNFLIRVMYPSKLVNKVITNSKGVEKILENDYRIESNKLKTIYNGVDLERINQMKNEKIYDHKELFYDEDIIKFITIGRLIDLKGHKHLIEAYSEVKKELSHSKLIIIGEGPLREELKCQIKLKGLEDDVFLLGMKKNPYKYLAKSDIFVLSSKRESFPNVLLEALACGLPIISTDCETGPREILGGGKYGLLVNVLDNEDLKKKMVYLSKNKKVMVKFSNLSLKRAEYFNLNKIIDIWINTINNEL
ncbi:MAG: glycosyltransferase [Candidatus Lokiarchaeia archaeon]